MRECITHREPKRFVTLTGNHQKTGTTNKIVQLLSLKHSSPLNIRIGLVRQLQILGRPGYRQRNIQPLHGLQQCAHSLFCRDSPHIADVLSFFPSRRGLWNIHRVGNNRNLLFPYSSILNENAFCKRRRNHHHVDMRIQAHFCRPDITQAVDRTLRKGSAAIIFYASQCPFAGAFTTKALIAHVKQRRAGQPVIMTRQNRCSPSFFCSGKNPWRYQRVDFMCMNNIWTIGFTQLGKRSNCAKRIKAARGCSPLPRNTNQFRTVADK